MRISQDIQLQLKFNVNEQNPKARNFYRHLGFREYERTDSDSQGRPFPIIKMELHA